MLRHHLNRTELKSLDILGIRLLLWWVIFSCASEKSGAQDFLPLLSDNYAGINQAQLQPAAIADSRFRYDINVAGFNCDVYNNGMYFNSKWLRSPLDVLTNKGWWDKNTSLDKINGLDKDFIMSQSVVGPAALIPIGEKQALGLIIRMRSITNSDDLSEPLFRSVYLEYEDPMYWNRWFYDHRMRSSQHIFRDYSLVYAAEIMNKGSHFMKIGGTVKLIQGIAAAYVQCDSLFFYYDNESGPDGHSISWNSSNVGGGLSGNWSSFDNPEDFDYSMFFQTTDKPSVGLDLGLVYEYRPGYKQYVYNVDNKRYLVRKDLTKYLFKVGISVLDIGRLKYKKMENSFNMSVTSTEDYFKRYIGHDNSVPSNTYWMDVRKSYFSYLRYTEFVDTLYQRYLNGQGVTKNETDPGYFTMKLPAAMSVQVDFKVYRRFFVNLTTFNALIQGYNDNPHSHYISIYSLTARYESRWLTVAIPVTYNQYDKINFGLGVRTPYFYFGVNNFISAMFKDRHSLNIYFGIKVSVFNEKTHRGVDNDIRAF
jgi:hypothetical protein